MARPKKDESIRRTHNVMIRFTDVEYALVSCSAEQAGYPVAVYVRKQAITEKLHVHYNIVADIAELRDFSCNGSEVPDTATLHHRDFRTAQFSKARPANLRPHRTALRKVAPVPVLSALPVLPGTSSQSHPE